MLWWSLGSENFNRIWSILSYVVILVKYSLGRVFGGFGCHFSYLVVWTTTFDSITPCMTCMGGTTYCLGCSREYNENINACLGVGPHPPPLHDVLA